MKAERLEPLISIFTTPGFTDERIHLFLAHGLTEGPHRREADEFLEVHPTAWSDVMDLIARGSLQDGKTLAALLYAHCFKAVGRRDR